MSAIDPRLRVVPITAEAINAEAREIGIIQTAMWLKTERHRLGFPKPPDAKEQRPPDFMRDLEYAQIIYDQFLDPSKETK